MLRNYIKTPQNWIIILNFLKSLKTHDFYSLIYKGTLRKVPASGGVLFTAKIRLFDSFRLFLTII